MKTFQILCIISLVSFFNCHETRQQEQVVPELKPKQYITVLGVAQDAGFPQMDCEKECCQSFYNGTETKKLVSSLGLIDLQLKQKWLFDATPDITKQIQILKEDHLDNNAIVDGVFLTHAHIGHYTGLMYFGREATGANQIPVYVMPRMKQFLETQGPWSQLVDLENIKLHSLSNDSVQHLNSNLKVIPFLVPHRDEFSETVGYKIVGKEKSALYIPDIDKWTIWKDDIVTYVKQVDYAFLDATFFKDGEINRPMTEVPHPFIEETVNLFEKESKAVKSKIHFIHFNHTNPALKASSVLKDSIKSLGFNFAREGDWFEL